MNTRFLKPIFALGISASLAASALAQDAPPPPAEAPQGALAIPTDITLFGKNDPNVRRATAVVNGDIITGTDVDQHRRT